MLGSQTYVRTICNRLCEKYHTLSPECEILPCWYKCPIAAAKALTERIVTYCPLCSEEFYTFIYWKILINCIFSMYRNFSEFMDIYENSGHCITTWRDRKFFILSARTIKRARLFGSSFQFLNWLILFWAVMLIKPVLMLPWLYMNLTVNVAEAIMYLFDLYVGNTVLNFRTVISFLLLFSTSVMVLCLYRIFQQTTRSKDELCLWRQFWSTDD